MHKKIGIIGGMSPESTIAYYETITHLYTERFGDYGYPPILIYSVSFQPYVDWPNQGRWDLVAAGLSEAAQQLERAGADFIIIATNTMHLVLKEIQACVTVPVLSLLDVVRDTILARGMTTVGLLGTRFTMEQTFFHDALAAKGIAVLVPAPDDRALVNRVIYEELTAGQILDESRAEFVRIILFLRTSRFNVSQLEWDGWIDSWRRFAGRLHARQPGLACCVAYAIGIARADEHLMDLSFESLGRLYEADENLLGAIRDIDRLVVFMKAATSKNRTDPIVRRQLSARGIRV